MDFLKFKEFKSKNRIENMMFPSDHVTVLKLANIVHSFKIGQHSHFKLNIQRYAMIFANFKLLKNSDSKYKRNTKTNVEVNNKKNLGK
jgi:hypothetical protein